MAAIDDRVARLRAATEGLSTAQRDMTELARMRRALIQDLHDEGWSYTQIAEAAGLSRGRIHQVRHHGPSPEGAFFGRGPLTVATPLKREERAARPVVAAEDVATSQRLGELARSLDHAVEFEQIAIDGRIDLDRDGLIVICGPRISKDVAGVLAADPALQFEELASGWALRDRRTGRLYKSGQDEEDPQPYDIAYLGRLERPDGKGRLIVFTGIHPPGTLGVVQLLTNDLSRVHRAAGEGAFSVLLHIDYDKPSHEPTSVQMVTPIYKHADD